MAGTLAHYRVFIASPGGLLEEREAFRDLLRDFNERNAIRDGAYFEAVGWEDTLAGVGRPQALINEDLRECDYFIPLLNNRWGSRPTAEEDGEYSSGTEEEYHVALECYGDDDRPMRQLVLMFKQLSPDRLADPGPQLQKVIDFKAQIEREKRFLYDTYDELARYEKLITRQLDRWLYDHRNEEHGKSGPPPVVEQPAAPTEGASTDEESSSNPLVDEAERLANEGRLVEAETKFASAAVGGRDFDAINRYGHFLRRLGRLAQAEAMYQRVAELGITARERAWEAKAYGNLGLIYATRWELDRAEEMHNKGLAINEELGRREGTATTYGNLGVIYETRGQLDRAREYWTKARDLFAEIGMLHQVEKYQEFIDRLADGE